MSPTLNALLIGMLLGAAASGIGGLLSYFLGLRQVSQETAAPLVLLFMTVLFLGMIGVIALIIGTISGNLLRALITGLGVVIGFSVAFALLLLLYFQFDDS